MTRPPRLFFWSTSSPMSPLFVGPAVFIHCDSATRLKGTPPLRLVSLEVLCELVSFRWDQYVVKGWVPEVCWLAKH